MGFKTSYRKSCSHGKLIALHTLQGEDGKKGKKKKSADLVELPLDGVSHGYNETERESYRNQEVRNHFSFFRKIN